MLVITRDDVVSPRRHFGRWYVFIGVRNYGVFLTFPYSVPLVKLKERPENFAVLLAATMNHV